jgi:hypothetical protein
VIGEESGLRSRPLGKGAGKRNATISQVLSIKPQLTEELLKCNRSQDIWRRGAPIFQVGNCFHVPTEINWPFSEDRARTSKAKAGDRPSILRAEQRGCSGKVEGCGRLLDRLCRSRNRHQRSK